MTIDEGTLEAFQEAKVSMHGDRLSICPEKRSVVSALVARWIIGSMTDGR